MAHRYSTEVKGHADFSGYWRVAKLENFDAFLQDLGFPWVVRKAALKFAGNAIDVISHAGVVMKVTSLNAKGSWYRVYDTEKEVAQPNAEGVMCKTTSWWEGKVFRTKVEGSPLGPCESWRYLRNGIMVVKTSVKLASGADTSMFWYFEAMEVLQRHLGGQGRYHLLRRIERDQRQVQKATREDNRYLQRVLLNWDRWASPADEFIQVVSPSYSRARVKVLSSHAGSPHVSQGNLSKSPSASSLGSPLDMRSVEGRSGRSDVGSRSRLGSESTSALDKATIADLARADRTVAAAAPARASAGHHTASHPASLPASRPPSIGGRSGASSPVAGAAPNAERSTAHSIERGGAPPLPPSMPPAAQQLQQRPPGEREFHREISLSYRQEDTAAAVATTAAALANGGLANSVAREAAAPLPQSVAAAAPAAVEEGSSGTEGGLTFPCPNEQHPVAPDPLGRHFSGTRDSSAAAVRLGKGTGSSVASLGPALVASGPSMTSEATVGAPSDLATMGSGSVMTEPLGAEGLPPRRVGSGGSLSTAAISTAAVAGSVRAPPHRKNLSGEAIGSDGRASVRPTPRSTPTHRQLPTNAEQLLAFKAHEFLDSRGIMAVVPVATPNDTSEPQLLCMSPEQAEQTHAKLRELEEEMLLQRQEYRKGVTCCGWFVMSWVSSSLPDHLRVWEMSVS